MWADNFSSSFIHWSVAINLFLIALSVAYKHWLLTSNMVFQQCLWPAHIGRPTSNVAFQYHALSAHIILQMSASCRQHPQRPTHTNVECARLPRDVVLRLAISTNSCTHKICLLCIDSTKLFVSYLHYPRDKYQWKTTSSKDCMYHPWPMRIKWASFIVT